ncbi:MAG: hypothetical protein ACRCYO_19180 [Bacteroidia bacterium]
MDRLTEKMELLRKIIGFIFEQAAPVAISLIFSVVLGAATWILWQKTEDRYNEMKVEIRDLRKDLMQCEIARIELQHQLETMKKTNKK